MSLGRDCDYRAGTVMARGYLAIPAMPKGGVLLIHEAPGVGPHVRRRVDALAQEGFIALAADLHGEGRLAPNPGIARGWVETLKADPNEMMTRMNSALEALRRECGSVSGNIAVSGYCFGGWCALELARAGAELRSVTVFHGSLASSRGAEHIKGSVLVCTGDSDPFVPVEKIFSFSEEMKAAGIDYQLCLYGGTGHGFTDRDAPLLPGFGYNAASDKRSWHAFLKLLAEQS